MAKYAKNRFSWLPWKRTGCHEHLLVLFKNKDILYIRFYNIAVKSIECVNFMTYNLNLLSYIELVGGVFAPLLFVFYINLL